MAWLSIILQFEHDGVAVHAVISACAHGHDRVDRCLGRIGRSNQSADCFCEGEHVEMVAAPVDLEVVRRSMQVAVNFEALGYGYNVTRCIRASCNLLATSSEATDSGRRRRIGAVCGKGERHDVCRVVAGRIKTVTPKGSRVRRYIDGGSSRRIRPGQRLAELVGRRLSEEERLCIHSATVECDIDRRV